MTSGSNVVVKFVFFFSNFKKFAFLNFNYYYRKNFWKFKNFFYSKWFYKKCLNLKNFQYLSVIENFLNLSIFYRTSSQWFFIKKANFKKFAFFIKNHWELRFLVLSDIVVVDRPLMVFDRFEIFYRFFSIKLNKFLFLKFFVSEWEKIFTLTFLFLSANWLEREVWDMFGIFFLFHFDLRRILTDYGFFGYPLRKDFPLTGYFEVRYDDFSKRVILESLDLVQELRIFFFFTPWNKW